MERSYDKTKFITGLRGYSAMAVFLVHSGGLGLRDFSVFTNRLVSDGRFGVVAFFVLSAFTICMSIDNSKHFTFKDYFIKRFFRIVPLYVIVIIVAFLLGGIKYYQDLFGVSNNLENLFYHLLIFNLNYRFQNSIIGVEWTIAVECFYYLLLPIAFLASRKKPQMIAIIVILAILISVNSYFVYVRYLVEDAGLIEVIYHLSVFKYAFCFAFGILIYRARNIFSSSNINSYVVLLWIVLLFNYMNLGYGYQELFYTVWVGGLIIFCMSPSALSTILFENKIITYLGEISYSIYLVHFILIIHWFPGLMDSSQPYDITGAYLLLGLTISISSLTHFLIEKPFINLGRRLTNKKKTDTISPPITG